MECMDLPSVKLYAADNEIQEAYSEWAKFRTCFTCGASFNWLHSYGKWECKQHLGEMYSQTLLNKRKNIYEDVRGYWNCCNIVEHKVRYQPLEIIREQFRSYTPASIPEIRRNVIKGCIPCDHSEHYKIYDDGVRINVLLVGDKNSSFAPLNGHTVNGQVLYEKKEKVVEEVFYDKTYNLQEVSRKRIPANELTWPDWDTIAIGQYYDWNLNGVPIPVKILARNGEKVTFQIKNIGKPVHEVAAMIPHMGGDVETRPGWQFDEDEESGKMMFPHIQHTQRRDVALNLQF